MSQRKPSLTSTGSSSGVGASMNSTGNSSSGSASLLSSSSVLLDSSGLGSGLDATSSSLAPPGLDESVLTDEYEEPVTAVSVDAVAGGSGISSVSNSNAPMAIGRCFRS